MLLRMTFWMAFAFPFLIYDEGSSMPLLKYQRLIMDKRGVIYVRRVESENGKH